MLFNSFAYIFLFFPVSIAVYCLLQRLKQPSAAKCWLLAASFVFYGYTAAAVHIPLLLASMTVNYVCAGIIRTRLQNDNTCQSRPKAMLACGIAWNIALLGIFKYADFFITNANWLTGTQFPLLRLALPLAISFYTFQQITYLVDTYRGLPTGKSFLDYMLFVLFFPQLLAGPIVRYGKMMPQFEAPRHTAPDYRNMSVGLLLFFLGLCKRVIIADTLGLWANTGFSANVQLSCAEAWVTSLSYTLQLYYDFSGYTDMAIGSAYFFNIKLPLNFNSPYQAVSIQDFWRRWHITLSTFLRDYIYIPLGGNRISLPRTYINLFATFLLGGLWHGAGWTFVIWGALHGGATVVHRFWQNFNIRLPRALAIFITFNFVNVAWVFFRASTAGEALNILRAMVGLSDSVGFGVFDVIGTFDRYGHITTMAVAVALLFLRANSNGLPKRFVPSRKAVGYLTAAILISLLFLNSTIATEFLYFDF